MKPLLPNLGACLLLSLAARIAAPQTAPAESRPADPRWTALLQKLGDTDFAQRETAQKQLDQTTWRDLPLLQRSADAVSDAEVKARLAARISFLLEDLSLNPPPISINLKDASVRDVAQSLSKALGTTIESYSSSPPTEFFDLNVTEQPFWEVFVALSRQHPLMLQDYNGPAPRMSIQSIGLRNGAILGPIAVFPMSLSRQRSASLQSEPAAQLNPETLSISGTIAFDPRLRIAKYTDPVITEIVDDEGRKLFTQPDPGQKPFSLNRNIPFHTFSLSFPLPEKHSARIASLKGVLHYVAIAADVTRDVTDLDTKTGEVFNVGTASVRLTQFALNAKNPATVGIRLSYLENPDGSPRVAYPTAFILDDTGRIVAATLVTGDSNLIISGGTYVPPLRLRLSDPTKIKDIHIPFELKDLPIP